MSLSVPNPSGLPADLAEHVAAYLRVRGQLNAAQVELGVLERSLDQARRDDAQALSEAAREGGDIRAVGTPAQDRVASAIHRQRTLIEGLVRIEADLGFETKEIMKASSADAVEHARARAEELRKPYMDAIEAVGKAARAFDATLFDLAGWLTFIQSGGRRVGFGDGGTITINGSHLDPFSIDGVTASLRAHARRFDALTAAIDKADPLAAPAPNPGSLVDVDAAVWAA